MVTQELLDDLELQTGLKALDSVEDFKCIMSLEKAIIYLLVNWSGPERISRYVIYKTLNELQKERTPVFKIDCSDQKKMYVVDWLAEQEENQSKLYFGGWGETLLVNKGMVIDTIKNPALIGYEKTREILREWIK